MDAGFKQSPLSGAKATGKPVSRDMAQPGATGRDISDAGTEIDKAKPNAAPGASNLSPRQLAAARELARGKRVGVVATELQIHRGTIFRWQRDPEFARELRRLHRVMLRSGAAGAKGGSTSGNVAPRRQSAWKTMEKLAKQFGVPIRG
jgi:hypothetical protein